jgi:hypothetical protein
LAQVGLAAKWDVGAGTGIALLDELERPTCGWKNSKTGEFLRLCQCR